MEWSRADEAEVVLHVVTAARRRCETFAVDSPGPERGTPSEVVALAPADAGDPLPVPVLGRRALAPATLRALRRRARRARAVVAHGSRTLPAAALALAGLRTPAVYRSIGDPAAWAGTGRRRLQTRLLLSRMDAVTVLWPAAADEVHRLHGVPERLHVLLNAVPTAPGAEGRPGRRPAFHRGVVAVVAPWRPKRVGDVILLCAACRRPSSSPVTGQAAALEERAAASAGRRLRRLAARAGHRAAPPPTSSPQPDRGHARGVIEASGLPAVADVGGVDQVVVGEIMLVPPATCGLPPGWAGLAGASRRRHRALLAGRDRPVARAGDLLATLTDPDPGPAGGARRRPPGRRRRHGRGRAPTLGRPADQGGGSTP